MKFVFDTDHLSILQRAEGAEFAALFARFLSYDRDDFAAPVVGFHEQSLGAHTYISRAKTTPELLKGYSLFMRIVEAFAGLAVLPFDAGAAAALDDLVAQGVRIKVMDLRIASIALSRGLTLLTRNAADFGRVPGLKFEDWTR